MSAARRYRPVPPTTIGRSPGGEQSVDLLVGELGVLPGAELSVNREERQQPVLELRPLRGTGGSRDDLEAGVDLERVGRDGDRILAALPQEPGEVDGDTGLADPGGAEDRDHVDRGMD